MKEFVGKRWGQLSEKQQDELRNMIVDTIDGESYSTVKSGPCIVDFENGLSVGGYVKTDNDEIEIIIDDNEIIYNPEEGVIYDLE